MISDNEFEQYCKGGTDGFHYCNECGKRRLFSQGYCNECGSPLKPDQFSSMEEEDSPAGW